MSSSSPLWSQDMEGQDTSFQERPSSQVVCNRDQVMKMELPSTKHSEVQNLAPRGEAFKSMDDPDCVELSPDLDFLLGVDALDIKVLEAHKRHALAKLLAETQHLSLSMPKSFPEKQIALCRFLHQGWPKLEEAALFTTETLQKHPLLLTNASMTQKNQSKTIRDSSDKPSPSFASKKRSDESYSHLNLNVHVGISLFFRILRSLHQTQNTKGLKRIAHQLPHLLSKMPPLALYRRYGATDRTTDKEEGKDRNQMVLTEKGPSFTAADPQDDDAVIEAISNVLGSLFRQIDQYPKEQDRSSLLTSIVGLAIKRGSLLHILEALRIIVLYSQTEAGASTPLNVRRFLKELEAASPYSMTEIIDLHFKCQRGTSGYLMSFGKADQLGHGPIKEDKPLPCFVDSLRNIELGKIASLSTHAAAITSSDGKVLSWGNGDKHRLGHGSIHRETQPRVIRSLLSKGPVKDVACGLGHTAVLLQDGDVYAFGNGANGRLGLGDTNDRSTAFLLTAFQGVKIKRIFAGASHSMAITDDGQAYSWGKNGSGQCGHPTQTDILLPQVIAALASAGGDDNKVSMLAGGWEHSLALTTSGHVYSFGAGYRDSRRDSLPPVLGHGEKLKQTATPTLISALTEDVHVIHIACGWDYNLVVGIEGELYTWGAGSNGKLGHGTDKDEVLPRRVQALVGTKILTAEAGGEHTAAISEAGHLYTWGQGDSGRLGHGESFSSLLPQRVEHLVEAGLRTASVALGDKYTIVLVQPRVMGKQVMKTATSTPVSYHEGDALKQDSSSNGLIEASSATTNFSRAWLHARNSTTTSSQPENSAIDCQAAALILISQLERLTAASGVDASRQSQCLLDQALSSGAGAKRSMRINQSSLASHFYRPYVIDISPQALNLLISLLSHLSGLTKLDGQESSVQALNSYDNQQDLEESDEELTLSSAADRPFQRDPQVSWTFLYCCLRIVKANIQALLLQCLVTPTLSGSPTDIDGTKNNVDSMTSILKRLHRLLVHICNHGIVLSFSEHDVESKACSTIQQEVASILSSGFFLFYPTTASRVALLQLFLSQSDPDPLFFAAFADNLAKDEVMASIVLEILQQPKEYADPKQSGNYLDYLLEHLLKRADTEDTDAPDAGSSPFLKVLLSMQMQAINVWVSISLIPRDGGEQAATKAQDVIIRHFHRMLSMQNNFLKGKGGVQRTLNDCPLYSQCFQTLLSSINALPDKLVYVFENEVPLLVESLHFFKKDGSNSSSKESSMIPEWFADLRLSISLLLGRQACKLAKTSTGALKGIELVTTLLTDFASDEATLAQLLHTVGHAFKYNGTSDAGPTTKDHNSVIVSSQNQKAVYQTLYARLLHILQTKLLSQVEARSDADIQMLVDVIFLLSSLFSLDRYLPFCPLEDLVFSTNQLLPILGRIAATTIPSPDNTSFQPQPSPNRMLHDACWTLLSLVMVQRSTKADLCSDALNGTNDEGVSGLVKLVFSELSRIVPRLNKLLTTESSMLELLSRKQAQLLNQKYEDKESSPVQCLPGTEMMELEKMNHSIRSFSVSFWMHVPETATTVTADKPTPLFARFTEISSSTQATEFDVPTAKNESHRLINAGIFVKEIGGSNGRLQLQFVTLSQMSSEKGTTAAEEVIQMELPGSNLHSCTGPRHSRTNSQMAQAVPETLSNTEHILETPREGSSSWTIGGNIMAGTNYSPARAIGGDIFQPVPKEYTTELLSTPSDWSLPRGKWTHVCCSCEYKSSVEAEMTIYINGQSLARRTVSSPFNSPLGSDLVCVYRASNSQEEGESADGNPSLHLSDVTFFQACLKHDDVMQLSNHGCYSQLLANGSSFSRYACQLLIVMQHVKRNGRDAEECVSAADWISLLLSLLKIGDYSIKKHVLHLLCRMLPKALKSEKVAILAAGSGRNATQANRKSILNHSIDQIMCILLHPFLSPLKLKDSIAESFHAAAMRDLMLKTDQQVKGSASLASDMTALLQTLWKESKWQEHIQLLLQSYQSHIQKWSKPEEATTSNINTDAALRHGLGLELMTFDALGGHVTGLHIGSLVRIQMPCKRGKQVSSDASTGRVIGFRKETGDVLIMSSDSAGKIRGGTIHIIPQAVIVLVDDFGLSPELKLPPRLYLSLLEDILQMHQPSNPSYVSPLGTMMEVQQQQHQPLRSNKQCHDHRFLKAILRCKALRSLLCQIRTGHLSSHEILKHSQLAPLLLSFATQDSSVMVNNILFDASSGNNPTSSLNLPKSFGTYLARGIATSELQDLVHVIHQERTQRHLLTELVPSSKRSNIWHQHRLEIIRGDVAIKEYSGRALSHFPSINLPSVSLGGGGRWFYEVILLTDGLMQIGWADPSFHCDPIAGQGVGDHQHSWSFDGFRQKRWSVSSNPYGARKWQVGDVLGVLLDLNRVEMRFYLNGSDQGPAFTDFQALSGLFPAASLNVEQSARFNFGQYDFLYPPLDGLPFHAVIEGSRSDLINGSGDGSHRLAASGRVQALTRRPCTLSSDSFERANADADNDSGNFHARRRSLVDGLMNMGFPMEWAMRAVDHCDASMSERTAISWIIEKMEAENEGLEAEVQGLERCVSQHADGGELGDGRRTESQSGNDHHYRYDSQGSEAEEMTNRFTRFYHRLIEQERGGANANLEEENGQVPTGSDWRDLDGLAEGVGLAFGQDACDKEDWFGSSSLEEEKETWNDSSTISCPILMSRDSKMLNPDTSQTTNWRLILQRSTDDELKLCSFIAHQVLSIRHARQALLHFLANVSTTITTEQRQKEVDALVSLITSTPTHRAQFLTLLKLTMIDEWSSNNFHTVFDSVFYHNLRERRSDETKTTAVNEFVCLLLADIRAQLALAQKPQYDSTVWSKRWGDDVGGRRTIPDHQLLSTPDLHRISVIWQSLRSLQTLFVQDFMQKEGKLLLSTQELNLLDNINSLLDAKQFMALLNMTTSCKNLTLHTVIYQLCQSMLTHALDHYHQVGPIALKTSLSWPSHDITESITDFLSISRERQMIQILSNRLGKESFSRTLYSPYLQSLIGLVVNWLRLRKAIDPSRDENDYIDREQGLSSKRNDGSDAPPALKMPFIVVENISAASIIVSWDLHQQQSSMFKQLANLRDKPAIGTIVNPSDSPPDVSFLPSSVGNYYIEIAAFSILGSEPFVVAATGLASKENSYVFGNLMRNTSYKVRLGLLQDDGKKEYSPVCIVQTSSERVFMLNSFFKGPSLVLNNGNMSVRNHANKKWGSVRTTTSFSTGISTWEVCIDRCISKNIFIGVVTADSQMDNYVGSDAYGWGYLANKAMWHSKSKTKTYGELFKEGDTLRVQLDMNAGTLSFWRNSHDLGVAVQGLKGLELFPAFSLYNKDDQLSLNPIAGLNRPTQCLASRLQYSTIGGTAIAENVVQMIDHLVKLLKYLPSVDSPHSIVSESSPKVLQYLSLQCRKWEVEGVSGRMTGGKKNSAPSMIAVPNDGLFPSVDCFQSWTFEMDQQLIRYLEDRAYELGLSCVLSLPYNQVLHPSSTHLAHLALEKIRARTALLLHLNAMIRDIFPCLDVSNHHHHVAAALSSSTAASSFVEIVYQHRHIMFSGIKHSFLQQLLERSATITKPPAATFSGGHDGPLNQQKTDLPVLNLSLPAASQLSLHQSTMCSTIKDYHRQAITSALFDQVVTQVGQLSAHQLRRQHPARAFAINVASAGVAVAKDLTGEQAQQQQQAKLYRSLFFLLGYYMRQQMLPPHNSTVASKERGGGHFELIKMDRERWTKYRVLGQLMGVAIRTSVAFPLYEVDKDHLWEPLLTCILAAESNEVADVMKIDPVYEAISTGFSSIIPSPILPLLTAADLQKVVCGKSECYVSLFQDHVVYACGCNATHPVIAKFWSCLKTASPAAISSLFLHMIVGGPAAEPAGDSSSSTLVIKLLQQNQKIEIILHHSSEATTIRFECKQSRIYLPQCVFDNGEEAFQANLEKAWSACIAQEK